jgi:acylphosphatase
MSSFDFDVSTEEGRRKALEEFDKNGWAFSWPFWLTRQAYKAIAAGSQTAIQSQKDAAVEIIRAGRENNVKKMKITMDQTAGIDMGSDVEGIPLKIKLGNSGKVIIEVEYSE